MSSIQVAVANTPNPLVEFASQGAVGRIILRRAPVNAMNDALIEAMDRALDEAEQAGARVVIFASEERAFCAGADLKMVGSRVGHEEGAAAMEHTVRMMHRVFDRIERLDAVTIAEIGGIALGGGLELALACDLRIAADTAILGLPEPDVGLLPGAGGTQRLTRLCGPGLAARVILAGDKLTAAQAVEAGLVQWTAPAAELTVRATDMANRIAGFSAMALIEAKRCIALATLPGHGGAQAEIAAIRKLMTNPDSARRVAAFVAR